MQLFYAPDFTAPRYRLRDEEARHALRVLRLRAGDPICLTDGRGSLYRCRIERIDPKGCEVALVAHRSGVGARPWRLSVAVAPTKNPDRFEWFLEKAAEVGIDEIIPLETARSERRTLKRERGDKILVAAMKQSLKCSLPQLHELTPFETLVRTPFDGLRLIAHCDAPRTSEGKRYLPRQLAPGVSVQVLIGPEGDFSPAEIDLALACGFRETALGSQRLRTETAAVAATLLAASVNEADCPAFVSLDEEP